MKFKYKIFTIVFAICILFNACCSKEALVDVDFANFQFIDKVSGENLFGLNGTLNIDSVYLKFNSTGSFQRLTNIHNQLDSVINIDFDLSNQVFIKFSNNDVDTFIINYSEISSKTATGQCKLTASVINGLMFNREIIDVSNLQKTIIIYK
jgi:hypothetical protein